MPDLQRRAVVQVSPAKPIVHPGDSGTDLTVTTLLTAPSDTAASIKVSAPEQLTVDPRETEFDDVHSGTIPTARDVTIHLTAPAGTPTGTYPVTVRVAQAAGDVVTKTIQVTVRPPNLPVTVAYVDSEETSGENAPATNAVDGNPDTIWHTKWSGTAAPMPHEIQLNLGGDHTVSCLSYLPRQNSANGRIAKYEVYTSKDGTNWGNPVATGTWTNTSAEQEACFTPVSAHYVRLRALSEVNGNPWTTAAEINVVGLAD
ncbi:discoidin domain-containing protein [Streptomyces sp. NBC_01669]|uniref:discoidin domain-containing protein n=1 Tax=Streptomyces sp. NBC_01669 TaxID=2975909 RepID=UPI002257AD90|nr:discoidin domain-containing protein [Streptomyces sp. NBC_01669]MCX4538372.1 discoidin domain-containing protein [Streptomyces sp. NBC_01669]